MLVAIVYKIEDHQRGHGRLFIYYHQLLPICIQKRNWPDMVRQYIGPHQHWDEIVKNYLACLCARTILEQYTTMEQIVRSLVDFFSNDQNDRPDQGWATSVLRIVLKEYRFVATQVMHNHILVFCEK